MILLKVLDPEDVKPHAAGTTRIVDVESSQRVTLTIGQRTLDEYANRVRRNREQLQAFSFERGIPYFQTTTDVPVARFLHEDLRNGGMLR